MNLIIVIFKKIDSKEKIVHSKDNIYILNSNICNRQEAFFYWSNQWLLFFDYDCHFNEKLIERIRSEIISFKEHQILAGLYQNPDKALALQRAHNFIANQWLIRSSKEVDKYILGGFFAIYIGEQLRTIDYSSLPTWGGEDKALAILLQRYGYQIEIHPSLTVVHDTSTSLIHFIRRAWLHGYHFTNSNDKIKNSLQEQFKIWIRELKDLDRSVQFFVCFHFLILALAKLTQEVRQMNK